MELMDCKTLSNYLNVKTSTIRVWTSQGIVPHVKLGPGIKGVVRYEKKQIDLWITSCLRRKRRVEKRQAKNE
ncbi:MAG: helix-turn-helix domain-containing protein [Proteobacteria bacterium]|nr:helix-turn-helix domain-containing protein [Pseudomonadota bacterium]